MKKPTATLSHAQSLRTIGQCLDDLGVAYFALDKAGPVYVAWISAEEESLESAPLSTDLAICFNEARIRQSEIVAQSRRGKSNAIPDTRNLASRMRVLGHYLDRKAATDFTLRWSGDSVKLELPREQQSFSIHQNLYDLGVCMYLQRFGRSRFTPILPAAQTNGRPADAVSQAQS